MQMEEFISPSLPKRKRPTLPPTLRIALQVKMWNTSKERTPVLHGHSREPAEDFRRKQNFVEINLGDLLLMDNTDCTQASVKGGNEGLKTGLNSPGPSRQQETRVQGQQMHSLKRV